MKKNIHFSRGEWIASLSMLAIVLGSYLFYYLYDTKLSDSADYSSYIALVDDFLTEQARLSDSAALVRQARYSYVPYMRSDTGTRNSKRTKDPMYAIVKLDLNHCDSMDIVVVPQFGQKRAARLVEYRERLGGFYDLSQVREVYVLQDIDLELMEKYFYIRPDDVRKININTATYKELVSHPYLDTYLTKLIVNHRERNGPITSFEQLQSITHAYPELMEKLRHYVAF